MFTGIILGQGKVTAKRPIGTGMIFELMADFHLDNPTEGESIAVNGVCLTARDIRDRGFLVDAAPESLARTNLSDLKVGEMVNLERALRLSDRLGGHLVSGHVDAVTQVLARRSLGDFRVFTFAVPQGLGRYIIAKGSVALDGISLTVCDLNAHHFSVSIIPHSLRTTPMNQYNPGRRVNLELDMIGKYVEKLLTPKETVQGGAVIEPGGRLNQDFLAQHGFIS